MKRPKPLPEPPRGLAASPGRPTESDYPAPLRGVVLDLDGVLADSEDLVAACASEAVAAAGVAIPPAVFRARAGEGEDSYFGVPLTEAGRPDLDRASLRDALHAAFRRRARAELRPMPGAAALVEALRARGLPLAVASNADRDKVEAALEALGWPVEGGPWRVVLAGNDVPARKPAPDLYLRAVAALGLAPSEVAVLEDTPSGVRAARAAGCGVVAVASTVGVAPLEAAGATIVRLTVAEVTLGALRAAVLGGVA